MNFDIDVSGEDLLSKDYTICISNNKDITIGFKITTKMVNLINIRYNQKKYTRFENSRSGKVNLKIRLYSVIIYFLFLSIHKKLNNEKIILNICRDFDGKEADIIRNLEYLLIAKLKLNLEKENIYFCKLNSYSYAHKYSYLMRTNKKNKLNTGVKLNLEEIEQYLFKK
ncbi:MAG: hypothetical protein WCX82_01315 [archaeon]|jgi:hypothetical protein